MWKKTQAITLLCSRDRLAVYVTLSAVYLQTLLLCFYERVQYSLNITEWVPRLVQVACRPFGLITWECLSFEALVISSRLSRACGILYCLLSTGAVLSVST